MLDTFFYVGLPYLSVFVLVAGSLYRYRAERFSYSALSSQVLESKALPWGSIPWHLGILALLAGHALVLLLPGLWIFLGSDPAFLMAAESFGMMCSVLCVLGLTVLLVRRIVLARLQAVSTALDIVVLLLLLGQVALGLGVAYGRSWGSVWAAGVLSPYLWSLLTLQPDESYVTGIPAIVKFHLAGAWVIFALTPFTRLVHAFYLPIDFLVRAPQKVVWANARRLEIQAAVRDEIESRRYFLRGALGAAAGGGVLGAGALGTVGRYFLGPNMTPEEEAEIMARRVKRLQVTESERELELERMKNSRIRVAGMTELASEKGAYFIDYQMRPALAFRGPDGLPLLISAKCTHLGCTIASAVEGQGRILCPCHMSYFDLATGAPSGDSPAKVPLPILGWLLVAPDGQVVASRNAQGVVEGKPDADTIAKCTVFIAKQFEEEAMS